MADYQLTQGYETVAAVSVDDQNGNAISGDSLDAGSGSVSVSDSTTLSATLSSDQTSVTIESIAGEVTDNVVTISGTVGGTALMGTLAVDVVAPVPTSLGLTPGPQTEVAPS